MHGRRIQCQGAPNRIGGSGILGIMRPAQRVSMGQINSLPAIVKNRACRIADIRVITLLSFGQTDDRMSVCRKAISDGA